MINIREEKKDEAKAAIFDYRRKRALNSKII